MFLTSDIPPWLVRAVAFTWGAVWGSFFNVAIYRWPREMSVVTPPSHCPACGTPIAAWRNVPIVGWLMLRGRASCCGAKVSIRYPLVELLSALLCVALVERLFLGAVPDADGVHAVLESAVYFAFVGGLLIAAFVDLEHMEIPDEVSLPLAALGLVTAAYRDAPGLESAALGAGGGFLLVQLGFVWSYERLFGRRGMGEGDSKLLMMIGAFLGWQGALFALVAGATQGLVVAGVFLATGKGLTAESTSESESESESALESESASESDVPFGQLKVPYGPFLVLGALEFLFFGDPILELYLSLFS